MTIDLFIIAGEASGDLHGAKLIEALLALRPSLKIGAVAGPRMRSYPITSFFPMENLQVMGFIDVFKALPHLVKQFFSIRNQILSLQPKAIVCIDYPGFNLRLERSLRKKGYRGKLIHFISPTVWAWRKNRVQTMEKNLDLLLTIFPFEKACFAKTKLFVEYVGHPLTSQIQFSPEPRENILALFPGSRKKEIERNLPLQLAVARKLQALDPTLQVHISNQSPLSNEVLMRTSKLALATSGTVTLELALYGTPTVVHYAVTALDLFLAQRIFRIRLPFYCIVNIIENCQIFPELFGPHFTEEKLFFWAEKFLRDKKARKECIEGCQRVLKSLGINDASQRSAEAILRTVDF